MLAAPQDMQAETSLMQAMIVSVTAAVVASRRPFQWFQRVSEENAA
jgi:hypothetical protein